MAETLLAQGAEAKVFLEGEKVVKKRIPKEYRHPDLDFKIRKSRTRKEIKILRKAFEKGINVPEVIKEQKVINPHNGGLVSDFSAIIIEFLDGEKLALTLNDKDKEVQLEILKKIGEQIGKLHDAEIVHGDLTTSNMILLDDKAYIIDFGLGYISRKIEDKAVDLHVLKQALEAKHWQHYEDLFEAFLFGYKPEDKDKILERLVAVERRGRYKKGS